MEGTANDNLENEKPKADVEKNDKPKEKKSFWNKIMAFFKRIRDLRLEKKEIPTKDGIRHMLCLSWCFAPA